MFEMTWAFASAATLVIVPPGVFGGSELAAELREHRVTDMFITPTALATIDERSLHTIRVLTVGGEACPPELVARWSSGRRMFNGYGPTEATIEASVSSELVPGNAVDIGAPARGFSELVLDSRLRPVPVGVPGELYISGAGLARGYHRRAGLTAGRFVANPFGEPGELMYRTGDIVRWRSDMSAEYIGRSDFQVKIRGFRIELGEIDTALSTHPSVAFAATIGHVGPSGDAHLVSYVLAAPESEVSAPELRRHAAELLPTHMVPALIIVLDSVPLTPVGKLDVKSLPVPVFDSANEFRAPTNPMEAAVADVFASVLGLEQVSVDDSFFDLGGNSLIATRLVTEMRSRLGRDVPLQVIFLDPTPAGIARRVDGTETAGTAAIDEALGVVIPLRGTGSRAPLFCVHPGIGLSWGYSGLVQHLDPDRPVFGLQLPLIGTGVSFPTIESLARHYVEQIRKVQPHGPYHLLGWSLGGNIAQAMAVELRRQGAAVGTLVLMDSYVVDESAPDGELSLSVAELVQGLGVDTDGRVSDGELNFERAVELLDESFGQKTGLTPAHLERISAGFTASSRMMALHEPEVFDGTITFFAASESNVSNSGVSNSSAANSAGTGNSDGNGHGNGDAKRTLYGQGNSRGYSVSQWKPLVTGAIREYTVGCEHNQMIEPSTLAVIGPIVEQTMTGAEGSEIVPERQERS